MDSIEIIEKIRAEIKIRLSANGAFDEEGDSAWHYDQGLNDAYNYILSFLSDLEKEEKPKRVRTLEEEFDGYNPIVVTLDKYVLEGIGVGRHGKVIIKIQRKED